MSDTELLVLAAKAAGYPAEVVGDQVWINGDYMAVTPTRPWWPLTDDGDALRLAVKLHMSLKSLPTGPKYHAHCQANIIYELVRDHTSEDAAMRRAIVRAAAEMGRAMP